MIKADLHVHSHRSRDCLVHPRAIIARAIRVGLNCVAVTDHNTVRGGLELLEEARGFRDFIAISGVEVKTDVGDVLALFVEEEVKSRRFVEVLDYVHSVGGVVVLAHPYRGHVMVEQAAKLVDAIEALNARTDRAANVKARELALKLQKPITAGSDAHTTFEVGRAYTVINGSTPEDVRKAIIKGETEVVGSESSPLVHIFSFMSKLAKLFVE